MGFTSDLKFWVGQELFRLHQYEYDEAIFFVLLEKKLFYLCHSEFIAVLWMFFVWSY